MHDQGKIHPFYSYINFVLNFGQIKNNFYMYILCEDNHVWVNLRQSEIVFSCKRAKIILEEMKPIYSSFYILPMHFLFVFF